MVKKFYTLGGILALAFVYVVAGSFGLSFSTLNPSVSAVWPPSGIALATLLLWGYRLWPGIFIGSWIVHHQAQGVFETSLAIAGGSTLEAIVGAALICRYAGGPRAFERARNVFHFIVFGAIPGAAVGSTIGVLSLTTTGAAPWHQYAPLWLTWWLGDLVSQLVVAPFILIWATRPWARLPVRRLVEALVLLVVAGLVGQLLFLDRVMPGVEFSAIPPLLWAAFRFGERGAVSISLVISTIALLGMADGSPSWSGLNPGASLLLLQSFLGTLTVTALALAAVVSERRGALWRLQTEDSVHRILAASPALDEAIPQILRTIAQHPGWVFAAMWEVEPASDRLKCAHVWRPPGSALDAFEAATRQAQFARGIGLPGRAWSSGKPAWTADVVRDIHFLRSAAALQEGLRAGFAFPIAAANRVVGVIESFSRETREPDDHVLKLVEHIGGQLGQFIERKRAEEALRQSENRLQLAMTAGRMGAWEWDLATDRVTWSPSLEEIHGLSRGSFGGRFVDFKRDIHPEDVDRVLAGIRSALEQRRDYRSSYRVVLPKGEVRWVEASGTVIADGDGRPHKLVGVCMDVTERRRAEEVLLAKEAQVRLIADTAPVMLAQCDRESRYTFVNRGYAERLGLLPEQIVGKTISEVVGEDVYRAVRPFIDRVLQGEPVEYEAEVPYARIGRRFTRVAYVPERDAQGRVVGWVSAISDITEGREAEETAKRRSRSLEIINRLGIAVAAELDLRRIVQAATDAAREISGAAFGAFFYNVKNEGDESRMLHVVSGSSREPPESLLAPGGTPLVAPASNGEAVVRVADLLQDPRCRRNTENGLPADPPPVRSYLAAPVASRSGDVLGMLLLGHPEPDVFSAEAETMVTAIAAQSAVAIDNANLYETVRRRVDEFQKLIDTAPIGIAVATDSECRFVWGNPEFATMLGTPGFRNISKSAPGGENLGFRVLRDGREVAADDLPMQRACREGRDVLDEELEIVRDDGTVVHELCRATPLRDDQGRVRGCIGVFLDITDRKHTESALAQTRDQLATANAELEQRVQERTAALERAQAALLRDLEEQKRLEEQLRQAQKLESIGTLAGGIAHDFNNILNIIRGHAAVLADTRSRRELNAALKVIDETIERGAAIVQQLLAIARRSEAKLERADLNDAVERLRNLLGETFPRTIEIELRMDPDLPLVTVDPNQIDQVLLNVCLNARDAMPDGGKLVLSTEIAGGDEIRERFRDAKHDQYACITVRDSGRGMDENTKERIFEPFFTTKEQGQGTGLGLSIVYGIIANHGGFIDVSSRPGQGTAFKIYLPIDEPDRDPIDDKLKLAPKPPSEDRQSPRTVLFVEDEVRQLELMRRFLERKGYRVLTAADGAEAVELHRRHQEEISVVVLDLGLPKLNGWEAFQSMKKHDPRLKAILATGYIAPEIEAAVNEGELSAIVIKPYQLNEILEKVSAAAAASDRN